MDATVVDDTVKVLSALQKGEGAAVDVVGAMVGAANPGLMPVIALAEPYVVDLVSAIEPLFAEVSADVVGAVKAGLIRLLDAVHLHHSNLSANPQAATA